MMVVGFAPGVGGANSRSWCCAANVAMLGVEEVGVEVGVVERRSGAVGCKL